MCRYIKSNFYQYVKFAEKIVIFECFVQLSYFNDGIKNTVLQIVQKIKSFHFNFYLHK